MRGMLPHGRRNVRQEFVISGICDRRQNGCDVVRAQLESGGLLSLLELLVPNGRACYSKGYAGGFATRVGK